jgi:hypothetical protein
MVADYVYVADASEEEEDSATGALRVAAAFALLFASAAGVLPPVLAQAAHASGADAPVGGSPNALRLKAFAAGVMLSLAVLHVIADSFERLAPLSEFPLAGLAIVSGILFMFAVERLTLDTLSALEAEARAKGNGGGKGNGSSGGASGRVGAHACSGKEHGSGPDEEAEGKLPRGVLSAAAAGGSGGHAHGHAHGVLLAHPAARKMAMAHLLEASILVHSVIIGADLGVSAAPRADVIGFTAVLAIHQFFEGIALGGVIADLGGAAPLARKAALAAAFCCTTPVGVLMGVAAASSFAGEGDGAAPRAAALAGTLDGITGACSSPLAPSHHTPACTYRPLRSPARASFWPKRGTMRAVLSCLVGGMLLHMTLQTFIGEEFSRPELALPERRRLRAEMYALLVLGVAFMAMLALWA